MTNSALKVKVMDKPKLYVIAGPNGAGKSEFGKYMIKHAQFLDGDKILEEFLTKNPTQNKDQGFEHVQEIFEQKIEDAIGHKKSLAYETNFSDSSCMTTPLNFKARNFDLEMIFFTVRDMSASKSRVKERVAKGGHNIDTKILEHNFIKGLENLVKFHTKFDRLLTHIEQKKSRKALNIGLFVKCYIIIFQVISTSGLRGSWV